MQYIVKSGDTWNSVASAMTIGGSAYGSALAASNDFPVGTALDDGSSVSENSLIADVRDTITIPDDWLKGAGVPATKSTMLPVMLLLGVGIYFLQKR